MITEDYVSFEVAKLLKEKGFREPVYHSINKTYRDDRDDVSIWTSSRPENHNDIPEEKNHFCTYSCPTIQMAMKWLREEHNKIIVPSIRVIDPITGIIDCYCVGIYYIPKNNGGALCFISPTPESGYSSYEEACEVGIKYCLENLMNK